MSSHNKETIIIIMLNGSLRNNNDSEKYVANRKSLNLQLLNFILSVWTHSVCQRKKQQRIDALACFLYFCATSVPNSVERIKFSIVLISNVMLLPCLSQFSNYNYIKNTLYILKTHQTDPPACKESSV